MHALRQAFTDWDKLTPHERAVVTADFRGMMRDEYDVTDPTASPIDLENALEAVKEYARRIGRGNIQAYAASLVAGQKRR